MSAPSERNSDQEVVNDAAEAVAKSVAGQAVSAAVGVATSFVAGPVAGMAAAAVASAAIDAAPQLAAAAERAFDAVSSAASEAGAAVSSALGLDAASTPDTVAKPVTNIGEAADKHVVAPTTVALGETAGILKSAGHTLAGAGAGVSTATTEPSPETRAAAAKVAKDAENTDIGMAAHKAVKVDSRAQGAFNKIQALLVGPGKTSGEKLTAIRKIGGIDAIDDSSFKAFLGIAQDALRMDRDTDTYHGKTSDVSEFLTNLSEGFAKIFTPEPGKSREGGAEEMNAAFAVCGESMKVGIGTLPAMQEAIGAGFESGFREAAKAAEAAREEEAKRAKAESRTAGASEAAPTKAPKEELSLKEIGKDSLKIAGSIALSLLVPGGFLIAMAACYILRDKKTPSAEAGLPDIDASLPITVSSRSSKAPAAPAAPSTSAAIPSAPAAPSTSAAIPSAPAAPSTPSTPPAVAKPPIVAFTTPPTAASHAAPSTPAAPAAPATHSTPPATAKALPIVAFATTPTAAPAAPSASTPAVAAPAVVDGGGIENAVREAEAAGVKSVLAGLEATEAKAGSGKPDAAIMAKGEEGGKGR